MLFAAYELLRPSAPFALHESKLDLRRMRVMKDARLSKGSIDSPKTGDVEVPLTPPARDTIANRPRNDRGLVSSRRKASDSRRPRSRAIGRR